MARAGIKDFIIAEGVGCYGDRSVHTVAMEAGCGAAALSIMLLKTPTTGVIKNFW